MIVHSAVPPDLACLDGAGAVLEGALTLPQFIEKKRDYLRGQMDPTGLAVGRSQEGIDAMLTAIRAGLLSARKPSRRSATTPRTSTARSPPTISGRRTGLVFDSDPRHDKAPNPSLGAHECGRHGGRAARPTGQLTCNSFIWRPASTGRRPHCASQTRRDPLRVGFRIGLPDLDITMPLPMPRQSATSGHAGIAVILVVGTLVRRSMGIEAASGLMSYGEIAARLDAALADLQVAGILLDLDSPGGEASGVFELAERIRAASNQADLAHANDAAFFGAFCHRGCLPAPDAVADVASGRLA